MNKRLSSSLKFFWLAIALLLVALPVFVPSFGGLVNVINVCLLAMILLSFPCNILVLPFFAFPDYHNSVSIGLLYTQLIICAAISYFQWFVLVPRLAKFAQKVISTDERAERDGDAARLLENKIGFRPIDRPKNPYDERERTPIERIIADKDE